MRRRIFTYLIIGLPILIAIWSSLNLLGDSKRNPPQTGKLTISDPLLSKGIHSYQAGEFRITLIATGQDHPGGYLGPRLVITNLASPGRWLWHTQLGKAFISAAQAKETVKEIRGSYFISDKIIQSCSDQTIDKILPNDKTITIKGILTCGNTNPVNYSIIFSPESKKQLAFSISYDQREINRVYLSYASDPEERFFGFGEQFSYFDHKGHIVPVWVSEQGIGRGLQPLTFLVDRVASAGGNAYTTYAVVPHYISSQMKSLFLENSEYSEFDLRQPDQVVIKVIAPIMRGRILYGQTPEDLINEYTSWAGRMRSLPDWILSGAVVGMQGGTKRVREVYSQLIELGTPISAFWLQDWVGQRTTSFGKQLWWNWELDYDRYPNWSQLRQELADNGVRLLVYASPFLTDVSTKPNARRNLFIEAEQAGFLVMGENNEPYLIQNTDFSAGLVDLTNPAAREWYKKVLKEQLIDEAGASGWMADFGEALPYDGILSNGSTGKEFHNKYPDAWAQFNRELIDSNQNGRDLVFFQRAAYQRSPAYATLIWEGDQLVSWDEHDGLRSAITGLLSGGISGFSLNHSDIGGYTTLDNPIARFHRSKELLMRWMEFSAMTTIYRTHEGNLPESNAQFYSDDETMAHFNAMAKVYLAWKHIRVKLVDNATRTGMPVARHLFINYPDDPQVYNFSYQEYLLGEDLLVAPVSEPDTERVKVYLPAGNWVHIWSGTIYRTPFRGKWVNIYAPIGQPAIFYREGSFDGMEFRVNLEKMGLIH